MQNTVQRQNLDLLSRRMSQAARIVSGDISIDRDISGEPIA